jgi:hypothetical protein
VTVPLNVHEALVRRHFRDGDADPILTSLFEAMKAGRLAAERATAIVEANRGHKLRPKGANEKAARDLSHNSIVPSLRVLDSATAAAIATLDDLEKFLAGSPNATPATRDRIDRLERANFDVMCARALLVDYVDKLTDGEMIRECEATERETDRVLRGRDMMRDVARYAEDLEREE